MEIGVSGVNGVLVPRRASKESSQGNENVTRQLHNTVARNAKDTWVNIKLAMKMFLVQVFEVRTCVFFFSACQLHNMHNTETDDVYFMSTTVVNGVHHVTSYERLRCFKIVFFSELSPRLCRILQDLWYIFFQLTENGENGVSGVLVQKLVNRENNRGKENVTHQLHSMAARNVMDSLLKHKLVTRKSHAPVSLYLLNYMVQLVYSLKPRKRKT